MELLIIACVIIVLLLILGIPAMNIIAGVLGLVILFSVLCNIFFIIMFIVLCFTKSCETTFLRVDKKNNRIPYAVYLIDNREYSNIFPTDMILTDILYRKNDVKVRVKETKKGLLVLDSVTQLIIILGLIAFSIMTLANIIYIF